MTMSSTVKKSAGRRTVKEAEEDLSRIIRFLAESEDGKSQNQIFQALQNTTNWSTIRRDFSKYREEGLLSTKKGSRGAILHYLTTKGLLKYLSQYGDYRPEDYTTIGKLGEDTNAFRKRFQDNFLIYKTNLENLTTIIEKEGKRLQFTIFSEIRTFIKHFPPHTTGSIIIDMILNIAKSSEIWKPTIKYETYYEMQRESLDEIFKHLEVIKTNPSLRHIEGIAGFGIHQGKKGRTFIVDMKEHYDLQKGLIEQNTSFMMRNEEDGLQRIFTEAFLEQAYFIFKYRDIKVPNTKLHNIALEIANYKEKEYHKTKSIAEIFAKSS